MRLGAALVAGAGLALAGATAASAHVSVSGSSAEAGSYTVLSFSVPHGCDGSATTTVAIQIPEGINSVTPTRHAFYTVEKVSKELAAPITDSHGNEVTERVAQVIYTATTPLPDGQRDTFELSLQLPTEAAGSTLFFPTVQTCEQGETAWVQIPEEGQDSHALDAPAPSLAVAAASDETGHGHDDHATTAEDHSAHGASSEQGAGSSSLSLVALLVGIAGLAVGAVALLRGRPRA